MMYRLPKSSFQQWIVAVALLFSTAGTAQNRSVLLSELAPFYHGVASGDPTPTAVIIWTRITTTAPAALVKWRMSSDTAMLNILQTGNMLTDGSRDFTVKVDVTGLQPNTTYYYEFESEGRYSLRGRTKTAPVGPVSDMRLALVSCSNYAAGYFNAYKAIKDRNDVDAVVHLGDYIYEYGNGQYGNLFNLQPPTEILALADYRLRYNYYRLDSNLMRLHQQFAFITIWDDHESANDSYMDGAENHTEGTEGSWVNRKAYSIKAYREWLPIRDGATVANIIYRGIKYGELADIICLDTRLIGREKQLSTQTPGALQDTTRRMMGPTQMTWFQNRISSTTAQWKVVAQQVMMAPLTVATAEPINMDQWDGYEGERRRLYNIIAPQNNVVVLTGDIHTSWANELPAPLYVPGTTGAPSVPCQNSLGVEYVVTSVTSPGLESLNSVGPSAIMANNPHIKYSDFAAHGFGILDITPTRAQHEWYFLSTITSPSFTTYFAKAYAVTANQKCLTEVTTPSIAPADKMTTMAPTNPRPATVILPVRFLSVTGQRQPAQVMLTWLTAAQTDCSHYIIERSGNGATFEAIGQVSCNTLNRYSFADSHPLPGITYYRVVMQGTDGAKTHSAVVKIAAPTANTLSGSWYPNPTAAQATCEVVSPRKGKAFIYIMDNRGAVIKKIKVQLQAGSNYISVPCQGILTGLYVYRVALADTPLKMDGAFIKM